GGVCAVRGLGPGCRCCHVFAACLARYRCPSLFPYTTLFRSRAPLPGQGCSYGGASRNWSRCRSQIERNSSSRSLRSLVVSQATEDRKSTRLNSSHVKISYAVFCLKKKTATVCCLTSVTQSLS